jgi:hypothetical protein
VPTSDKVLYGMLHSEDIVRVRGLFLQVLADIMALGRLSLEIVVFPIDDGLLGSLAADKLVELALEILRGEVALRGVLETGDVFIIAKLPSDAMEGEVERLGAGVSRPGREDIELCLGDGTVSLSASGELTNMLSFRGLFGIFSSSIARESGRVAL